MAEVREAGGMNVMSVSARSARPSSVANESRVLPKRSWPCGRPGTRAFGIQASMKRRMPPSPWPGSMPPNTGIGSLISSVLNSPLRLAKTGWSGISAGLSRPATLMPRTRGITVSSVTRSPTAAVKSRATAGGRSDTLAVVLAPLRKASSVCPSVMLPTASGNCAAGLSNMLGARRLTPAKSCTPDVLPSSASAITTMLPVMAREAEVSCPVMSLGVRSSLRTVKSPSSAKGMAAASFSMPGRPVSRTGPGMRSSQSASWYSFADTSDSNRMLPRTSIASLPTTLEVHSVPVMLRLPPVWPKVPAAANF